MVTMTKSASTRSHETSARRYSVLVLIGLGTFLLISAVLMRFYAYPTLAKAPLEQKSDTFLGATDATILDLATLKPITTDLAVSVRTQGDVAASKKAGDDVRVWVSTTSIRSVPDNEKRSRSIDRAPFGTVSGMGVDCCDGWTSDTDGKKTPTVFKGVVFKYPFNTQKKDYPYWDGTLGDSITTKYAGTETIQGLKVYKFTAEVPDTVVGQRDIPGSLVGSTEATLSADTHYANSYEIYVEPNTGGIVNISQAQNQYVEANGTQVPTTKATIAYTDAQITKMVKDLKGQGPMLGNLRGLFPLLSGILGLILLAAGVSLLATRRRS